MRYKNAALSARTYYDVTFAPGEVKDVPGYINDPKFIRIYTEDRESESQKLVKTRRRTNTMSTPAVIETKPESDNIIETIKECET